MKKRIIINFIYDDSFNNNNLLTFIKNGYECYIYSKNKINNLPRGCFNYLINNFKNIKINEDIPTLLVPNNFYSTGFIDIEFIHNYYNLYTTENCFEKFINETKIITTNEYNRLSNKSYDDMIMFKEGIKDNDFNTPILIGVLRDEIIRLPYFLYYYNKIGIKHFIFLDNMSIDGSFEFLYNSKYNITLFRSEDSYKENNQGNLWREKIMKLYGENRWYLLVDIDELFYYKDIENNKINIICEHCEKNNYNVFRSFALDMYPNSKLKDFNYKSYESFFLKSNYFDKLNKYYKIKYNLYFSNKKDYNKTKFYYDHVSGGVRNRCLNYMSQLTQHILIKYSKNLVIYPGTHQLGPKKHVNKSLERGVLLHFKWLGVNQEYIIKRINEKQMYNECSDYKNYNKNKIWEMNFYDKEYSIKLKNSKQLKELNIIY